MAVTAATLRKLSTLNLSPEQMAGVLELLAESVEAEESRKAAQAARKRRQRAGQSRDSHGTVTGHDAGQDGDSPPKESFPHTPFKEITPPKETKPKGLSKKGARLPENWKPTAEGWKLATDKFGEQGATEELAVFTDYWRAKPGKDGVKLDWDATWRNWVRNSRRNPREGPPKVLRGFQ